MKWLRNALGATLLLCAATAWGQAITFYEQPGFGGRSFPFDRSLPNFDGTGFNDRASSVVIQRGRWTLCTDAGYRGNCQTLGPGQYPNLASMGLGNNISSARRDGGGPPPPPPPMPGYRPPPPPPPMPGPPGNAPVTLFDGYNLSGNSFRVPGNVPNLDYTQWNDRARSMIVRYGNWQLCNDANYSNNCQIFGPGRYDNLGALAGTLSSLRQVR